MPMTTLALDTLRSLVTAVDLHGYGHAAARLGRTPSAISLQMKRLQADVGVTLFRRHGRGLALTEAGELVLRYARRMLELNDELLASARGAALTGQVSLGCAQDFADTLLPEVLAAFARLHPQVQVELRIDGNAALVDAVDKGALDVALALGQAQRAGARTLALLELVWIASRDFRRDASAPLPLVLLGPQCAVRAATTAALDAAGIAWRIAAVSPSLGGLWAAARGGLGITARTSLGLPASLTSGPRLMRLPALGAFPVTLHRRASAQGARWSTAWPA
jgi:DNA-binding transcriptional LysR family regulator